MSVPNSTNKSEQAPLEHPLEPGNTAPLTSSTSSFSKFMSRLRPAPVPVRPAPVPVRPAPVPLASGTLRSSSVTLLKNPYPTASARMSASDLLRQSAEDISLRQALKDIKNFNRDIYNQSENVKNLNYIFDEISKVEKCNEKLSLAKQSIDEMPTSNPYRTIVEKFNNEFEILKKSIQYKEYGETKKFVVLIDEYLDSSLNEYSDLKFTNERLAEDLYFQARRNLEEKGKTLNVSEIVAEVERGV